MSNFICMFSMKFYFSVLLSCIWVFSYAQPSDKMMSRYQYIDKYHDAAIKEMLSSGIPASITMAQALLESDNGNSPLARYANNHFGIKCHGWQGGKFIQDDDKRNECFRKYRKVEQSYHDHSEFLSNRSRYAFLFDYKMTDYKSWARGLRKAGYATNPKYADLLIKIIEDNELYKYDRIDKVEKLQASKDMIPVVSSSKMVLKPKAHQLKISDNKIKYVLAKKDDSALKIAKDQEMGLWQIYKYNDLKKGDIIKEGDIVYLQPKKAKARVETHVVKRGETIRQISQFYGIKINAICRKNNIPIGSEVEAGEILYLKKNAPIVK